MFIFVIEAYDKNNKVIVDAMDQINTSQLNWQEHDQVSWKYFQATSLLKERDKKTYKTNKNMVNVLTNLKPTMCHAFIKDQIQMPLRINIYESSSNEQPLSNSQDTNED